MMMTFQDLDIIRITFLPHRWALSCKSLCPPPCLLSSLSEPGRHWIYLLYSCFAIGWSLSVTVNIINLLILLVYTDRIPLAVNSLLGHQLKSDPLVWLQRQRQNFKIWPNNPKIWCDSANLDHGALPFPSDRRWGLSAEPDVVPERRSSISFQKSLYLTTRL